VSHVYFGSDMRLVGAVVVGVSHDEPSSMLTGDAKNTLINVLGVDMRPLVYRGKFVFVGQAGSPQKAVYELRDNVPPGGIGMDVLITGSLLKSKQVRASNDCLKSFLDCPAFWLPEFYSFRGTPAYTG